MSLLWLIHTANTDKVRLCCLVLSCLVRVGGVNGIGDTSRLSATENFETVLSSLEMWHELSLVLCWRSFHGYLLWRHLETSSQMHSHRRQDKTVLSPIYWKLSATVANSVHTADKTRQKQSCLVRVHGVNEPH